MRTRIIFSGFFLFFLFLITLPLTGAEREETIDKTFEIDASRPVEFEFTENDGDVRFSTWDRNEVRIVVRKEVKSVNGNRTERLLKDTKVDIIHNKNSIRVHIRYPRIKGFFVITNVYRVKVTSEILLPLNSNLTCRSDDGDIFIDGVQGEFNLRADDGTIEVDNSEGTIEAGTDDGRVVIKDFSGKVKIDSDDGDQLLSGNFTQLDLESDDGDVTIKNTEGTAMRADWIIDTDDGDVDIFLPGSFSADVRIDTDDGSIDSFLPIVFKELTSKTNLSGKLNEGGYLISIKTDDGDITLRELRF